jgi:ParB family chromosome partitioning protein
VAQGNKGFANEVANAGAGRTEAAARLPPRTGILGARENRLAELAAGRVVSRVHELVDPARCRIWAGHNRDYAALNETVCADLIESFKAQGRQEVPAIVRRVTDDPSFDYEVVCGARRHWTVAWLRANLHPEFRFLIEPRELTDEEAFRLADLENRSRKDLSDYERAVDYARAVDRYYGGSQQRMSERLDVSKSWLSRYLELARLPPPVIAAFGSPHVIGIKHAATLAPRLRVPLQRDRILAAAEVLAEEQATHIERGAPVLPPAAVLRRLIAANAHRQRASGSVTFGVRDPDGLLIALGAADRRGVLTITFRHHARRRRNPRPFRSRRSVSRSGKCLPVPPPWRLDRNDGTMCRDRPGGAPARRDDLTADREDRGIGPPARGMPIRGNVMPARVSRPLCWKYGNWGCRSDLRCPVAGNPARGPPPVARRRAQRAAGR